MEVKEFKDENLMTAFYFTKLTNNQFVIFSADNRSHPVMGIMDNDNNLTINNLPKEFSYWIEEEIDAVEFARDNNLVQSQEVKNEWMNYIIWPGDPVECTMAYQITKSPLLSTTWGQGYSYNDYTPNKACSNYVNGNTPTGCVPTATAQVMNFFQHPASYSWNSMPNGYGTPQTSQLMVNIAGAIGMDNHDYTCEGTGGQTKKVDNALKNIFGYTSASFGNYDYNTVVNEISQNKPVIISGGEREYIVLGLIPRYTDGHAWVADGYIRGYDCTYDENGHINGGYGYLLLHINWGWNGYFNGYFAFNNFSVNNDSYNYKNKMVYGIRK